MRSERVVICSAVRTPIGKFRGAFKDWSAAHLGAMAIKAAVERAGIRPPHIDKIYMGHVYTAGAGQSPKRQAAFGAGMPRRTPTTGIDAVCASGLEAIMLACHGLTSPYTETKVAVAGGMESMSNAPFLVRAQRPARLFSPLSLREWVLANDLLTKERLEKLTDIELKVLKRAHLIAIVKELTQDRDTLLATPLYDTLVQDGLTDAYEPYRHMGVCAELCVARYGFTREELDEFAVTSHERAHRATEGGFFSDEIVPVWNSTSPLTKDEGIRPDTSVEKLAKLKPEFGGLLTAGTSSQLSDGASALVLARESAAKHLGLPILARILGIGTNAQDPAWYTTAPAGAVQKALKMAGFVVQQIDLFEINEAFAPVPLAAQRKLGIDPNKINVHGGAIALGHPIGASGARIMTTLVHALKHRDERYGIATACNGGGEARAIVVEALT